MAFFDMLPLYRPPGFELPDVRTGDASSPTFDGHSPPGDLIGVHAYVTRIQDGIAEFGKD